MKPSIFDMQSSPPLNTDRPREFAFFVYCSVSQCISVCFSISYLSFSELLSWLSQKPPGPLGKAFAQPCYILKFGWHRLEELHYPYWMQEIRSVKSLARNTSQTIFTHLHILNTAVFNGIHRKQPTEYLYLTKVHKKHHYTTQRVQELPARKCKAAHRAPQPPGEQYCSHWVWHRSPKTTLEGFACTSNFLPGVFFFF